jgi:hypothetical protein
MASHFCASPWDTAIDRAIKWSSPHPASVAPGHIHSLRLAPIVSLPAAAFRREPINLIQSSPRNILCLPILRSGKVREQLQHFHPRSMSADTSNNSAASVRLSGFRDSRIGSLQSSCPGIAHPRRQQHSPQGDSMVAVSLRGSLNPIKCNLRNCSAPPSLIDLNSV